MNAVRSVLLAAMVVLGVAAAEAWATDADQFLGTFRKFGVGDSYSTSRKPCLCVGGSGVNGKAGRLQVTEVGGSYFFECLLPFFNAQGVFVNVVPCAYNGGSVVVLSK